jgi:UDP-glucose 4-epimerase
MRCLVTGAAGFIGSHLSESLLSLGFEVTGLDDLSVGRASNLSSIIHNERFYFEKCDITCLDQLKSIPNDYDLVFHLAGLADIVPSIDKPRRYFEVNVGGTLNVLEHVNKNRLKKFIYSASSSCYGVPEIYPTDEKSNLQPRYPYALTKLLGEQLVLHWGLVYKLPVLSLRLFNVYGPRARTSGTYGAVFGVFLAQKSAGKPLTVVGDGSQTRDFTFISDVVDAFLTAAMSNEQGEIFNVGSGGSYSINQLVNLIGGDVVTIPKRPGEPDCTFADISKITTHLNWRPKVTFQDGVKIMLQSLDSWSDAPVWTPEKIEKETELWFRYLSGSDARSNDN